MPSPPESNRPAKTPPPLALELPDSDAVRPAPTPRPIPPFPSPAPRPHSLASGDETVNRLLTTASIQLRRGQTEEAERAVREILTQHPNNAAAHEMMGDIRLSRNDWNGAGAAFKAALDLEPKRATAEAKMARATLRQTETQRVRDLGLAYAGAETAMVTAGDKSGQKNARLPVVGSLLMPGLGQMVNGQFVKGAIVMAVYFVGLALLYPHAKELAGIFVPRASQPSSAMLWFSLLLLLADWVYSLADAVQTGRRGASDNARGPKSGWEV